MYLLETQENYFSSIEKHISCTLKYFIDLEFGYYFYGTLNELKISPFNKS
jgi:hypothetical protein